MKHLFCVFTILFTAIFASGQDTAAIFHQDVSWSPDGKHIAFCGMHDLDRQTNKLKADIYVMRADGSNLRMISNPEVNEFYTSWAKGRIAFGVDVPGTRDSNIFTSDPDGSDLRQVTRGGKRNATPSLSRDGKRIAFVSTRDSEKYQIYTMNGDGSNVTRITKDDAVGHYNPQWSPDGKRIVYYSEKGDNKDQVWVMNADGSNNTLLTGGVGHNIFPGWSPDGKKIIFSSSKRDTVKDGSYVDGSFVYTMNADGSALAKVGNIQSYFARFSPDGKKIAYASGKFPSTAIYVANPDGSGAIKITN